MWPSRVSSLGEHLKEVVVVVSAIVGIAVGVKLLFFTGGDGSTPSGQIVFPASGDEVSRDLTVRGTLSHIDDDEHAWLAVKDGTLLFPQGSEISPPEGKWTVPFRQGGTTPKIGLELLVMGDAGNAFIENRQRSGDSSGITRIPGARPLDHVENLTVE